MPSRQWAALTAQTRKCMGMTADGLFEYQSTSQGG
jgi:hypothetical protein